MTFVPALNCAKVVPHYTCDSQQLVNTFWLSKGSLPTQGELDALAQWFETNWWAAVKAYVHSSVSLVSVDAIRQSTPGDIAGHWIPAAPVAGTGGANAMPLNASFVLTHRTALRGRSYRGRTYMPPLTSATQTGPGEGNLATLSALASAFFSQLVTNVLAGWTWNVVSHFLAGTPLTNAVLTPITGVSVNNLIDSQRRRLVGRGK